MLRVPPLLAECVLVGAIALTTACTWMLLAGTRTLSVNAVILCTLASVALAFAVEAIVKTIRRGLPRRAHARRSASRPCARSANTDTREVR